MSNDRKRLFKKLKSKKFREAFVDSVMGDVIATQIYNLRTSRGWSGKQLAEKAAMAQPRIPLLENPDYRSYTLRTLKRLADAFDVALIVRFAAFGELVDYMLSFSSKNIEIPDFQTEYDAQQEQLAKIGEAIPINIPHGPLRQMRRSLPEERERSMPLFPDIERKRSFPAYLLVDKFLGDRHEARGN
jgi:transcriptional regulator with XRE-family HTH domain